MEKETIKKTISSVFLVLLVYLFIFSLILIKTSISGSNLSSLSFLRENIKPINAFSIGWLLTIIIQSSGAATSTLILLSLEGIFGISLLVFMVIGTRIGTVIPYLLASLLFKVKKRDFRHGFEIGIANLVYAIPIAIFMFIIEYFFKFFSKTGIYFVSLGLPFKFIFIDIITKPLINLFSFIPKTFLVIIGIILLVFSLKLMPKAIFALWDKKYLKNKLNKHLKNKSMAFWIGFLLTVVLMSTSITITLLVPLIVMRVINLKKIIPYIIGAQIGGVMDTVLGVLVIGREALPAMFAYVSFSIIGLLWLVNTSLLFRITKYISKKLLKCSKEKAFYFVLSFIILAVVLIFI